MCDNEIKTWNCPMCDWKTIDIINKSGCISTHIKNKHSISVEEFISKYPNLSTELWKVKKNNINRSDFINDNMDNQVTCKICNAKLIRVSNTHLKKHNTTIEEYRNKYGYDSVIAKTSISKNITDTNLYDEYVISQSKKFILHFDITNYINNDILKFECICCGNIINTRTKYPKCLNCKTHTVVSRNVVNKPNTILCKVCNTHISPYGFTSHLANTHKITKEQYNTLHPDSILKPIKPKTTRKRNMIKCKLCNRIFATVGMAQHLKDTHNMTASEYAKSNGEYRLKYSKMNDVLFNAKHKVKCEICKDNVDYTDLRLSFHLLKKHNTPKVDYVKKYILNEEEPKCKCGCGLTTNILTYHPYKSEYIMGHNKSTLGSTFSEETKLKMSTSSLLNNKLMREDGIKKWKRIDIIKRNYSSVNDYLEMLSSKNITILNDFLNEEIVHFKCTTCNTEWSQRSMTTICETCYNNNPRSIEEHQIKTYIESLGHFPKTNRKILSGKEIDMYIESKNIGIEYNGLYYHSEISGYKDKNYHLNKTNACESNNIRLIHIFSDEWCNKTEIVKHKLKHILGNTTNKIYARKCTISEITPATKDDFLNKYHIQGADSSKIKLGLFYKNNLVAVMTFGSVRLALGYKNTDPTSYELIRYCSMFDTSIIGGASKLLSHFIKKYNPVKIISYADRRWTNIHNNIYKLLNFTEESISTPNYWYTKNYRIREHKVDYRKSVLPHKLPMFDTKLTDFENMINNGYDRVWDCGYIKYELIV